MSHATIPIRVQLCVEINKKFITLSIFVKSVCRVASSSIIITKNNSFLKKIFHLKTITIFANTLSEKIEMLNT